MAPPDYCEIDCGLLALEIASKPGWTRFASQGFSKAEAGLECHASVGSSSVAVLWTAFGSDSHRITRGRTGKRNSRIGIGVSIHGLGLGEPYTPNRSVTASLVATRSSFLVFSLAFGKREDGSVWSG